MDDDRQTPARTERRNAFGGGLILVALVVLAGLIISLDEIRAARTPMADVYAELPESGGLVAGAPVWIAGHQVGEVIAVTLLPPDAPGQSRVLAIARIPREHLSLLRRDSRANVSSARLMGAPVLALSPGTGSAAALAQGDTIPAEHAPRRFAATLTTARRTLGQVDSLMTELRAVAALYQARRPMIDDVMRSVDLASAELDRTALAFADGPLAGAMSEARLGERFAALRAALTTVQAGLGRYTSGPLGERIAALRVRTDSVRADVALLDSLTSDPSAGFVGRFLADSALMVESGRASAQLDTLAQEVLSNPLMFF